MFFLIFSDVKVGLAQRSEAVLIRSLVDLSMMESDLIHEIQKERGMSSGFIGSQGQDFQDEIIQQRKLTDIKINTLKQYLEDFDKKQLQADFRTKLNLVLKDLKKIGEVRSQVSNLEISLRNTLGYYTNLNNQFLNLIAETANLNNNGKISRTINAYVSFLIAKEKAGLERAVLANTFARKSFGPGMFEKLIKLITKQEVYTNVFKRLASPEQLKRLETEEKSLAFSLVNKYRQDAFSHDPELIAKHYPKDWFETITKKIDALKKIELSLVEDLKNQVNDIESKTTINLIVLFALLLAAIVVTFLLLYFIKNQIEK